jgi:hypothetical protein
MTAVRKPTNEKVSVHRARLRAAGLRPLQIWVPDVRSKDFQTQARRQARLVAASPAEAGDQAFIDAISVLASE